MRHNSKGALLRDEPRTVGGVVEGTSSPDGLMGCGDDADSVSLYLDRCQVDTPAGVVRSTWEHVRKLRPEKIVKVIDLGAGDGRFAQLGHYESYVGYEVDADRCSKARLPKNANLVNRCVFTNLTADADVCVGNPPFVRNQQIPPSWREHAREVVRQRTGVSVPRLANALQYFFLNALASLKGDGLAALIIPFEWLSRPSAKELRAYIRKQQWNVHVYRLRDAGFARVLTTASITIVDKATRDGKWEFHDETADGSNRRRSSPTGTTAAVLAYLRSKELPADRPRAKRGLSPGTQRALALTEEQRKENSLSVDRDVAACVTSLRCLPPALGELSEDAFRTHYVDRGRRCWLIRTDRDPSAELKSYLSSVPDSARGTRTCLTRSEWWRFRMPSVPSTLFAQGFRTKFPKVVRNTVGAHAVGGVCGIYDASDEQIDALTGKLGGMDLRDRVVSYSSGFSKVEINQINALLEELTAEDGG